MRPFLSFFSLVFCVNAAFAQDIHFSQAYNLPVFSSPALVGLYANERAYQRANLTYRNQWATVAVPYNTAFLSFDRQIRLKGMNRSSFGIGASLLHDEAGDSQLTTDAVSVQVVYHQAIAKQHTLALGIQVGGTQRRFQMQKLTFDNQYNGDVFDPSLSTRENIPRSNFSFLDVGVSAGYAWYGTAHQSLEAGFAVNHLDEPEQSFFNNATIRLPRRYQASLRAQLPLADRLDAVLAVNTAWEGKQTEMVFTALFSFAVAEKVFKKVSIYGGSGFRLNDALIPTVGVQYNQWRVGLSYDVTISAFAAATKGNGGIELSMQHLWYKVPPVKKAKACPVY